MKDDVFALESIIESDVPRISHIRLSKSGWVSYGIGMVLQFIFSEKLHYMDG